MIDRLQVAFEQGGREVERRIHVIEPRRDAVLGKLFDIDLRAEEVAERVDVLDAIQPAESSPAVDAAALLLIGRQAGRDPILDDRPLFDRWPRSTLRWHRAVTEAVEHRIPGLGVLGEVGRECVEVQVGLGFGTAVTAGAMLFEDGHDPRAKVVAGEGW